MRYKQNELMSLDDFRSHVRSHHFSYEIANFKEPLEPRDMERYVRAQDYEANFLFPIAWAGGDTYMQVLMERGRQHADRLLEPTRTDKLIDKYLDSLDPEFLDFLTMLAGHDWHYGYSDDLKVWERGNAVQEKLNAYKARGEMWENAYNLAAPK